MTTKVVRFLPAPPAADRWAGSLDRPGAPVRVALGSALTLPGLPPPRYAAVEVLWFAADGRADAPALGGDAHLTRTGVRPSRNPQRANAGTPTHPNRRPSVAGSATGERRNAWPGHETDDGAVVVAVEEVVGRGADALAARWADGGERFKMMSFGRRSPALTRAAFVERWRAEAGRLGGDRIPDALRGLAYVQDHPIGDDPPLDAINEVWFDRLDDLRRRAEWFAARPVPADLMSPPSCASLYLREVVVRTKSVD